jgi:hypothetical protein
VLQNEKGHFSVKRRDVNPKKVGRALIQGLGGRGQASAHLWSQILRRSKQKGGRKIEV